MVVNTKGGRVKCPTNVQASNGLGESPNYLRKDKGNHWNIRPDGENHLSKAM